MKGLKQLGTPDQDPYDRTTPDAALGGRSRGYVAARDGQYVDAYRKKRQVVLVSVETGGGWSPEGVRALSRLAARTKTRAGRDGTVYGTSRSSTRSFFVHHLSAVSAGVVYANALTLVNAAADASVAVTH